MRSPRSWFRRSSSSTAYEDLYTALHLGEGQLEALTGIDERRWWEEGYRISDGAIAAGGGLSMFRAYGRTARRLDLRRRLPRTLRAGDRLPSRVGVGVSPEAAVYDVSNACLGVFNGMVDIANRIELGQIRAGMVVACETAREINEIVIAQMLAEQSMDFFKISLATLTGGSGAVAMVLTDGSFSRKRPPAARRRHAKRVRFHGLCRWGIEETGPARSTSSSNSHQPMRRPCSPTESSWACKPGRPSSKARMDRRPGGQGDLPPGRRGTPRLDLEGARDPRVEGFRDLSVPGKHRHSRAADNGGAGRGARVSGRRETASDSWASAAASIV